MIYRGTKTKGRKLISEMQGDIIMLGILSYRRRGGREEEEEAQEEAQEEEEKLFQRSSWLSTSISCFVKVVISPMPQCLPSWSSASHFVTSSGVKPAKPPRERIVFVCSCSRPRTKSSSNGLEIGSSVWSRIARELQKEL